MGDLHEGSKKRDGGKMESKGGTTKRRAVACKSCHGLKVKCIPSNPDDLASPCIRCLKTKKTCEIDLNHSRKKKRPDDKVAELEQQVSKLKKQLKNQQSAAKFTNDSPISSSNDSSETNNGGFSNYGDYSPHYYQQNTISQRSGSRNLEFVPDSRSSELPADENLTRAQQITKLMDPNILMEISHSVTSTAERRLDKIRNAPIDVIDTGLLSLEEAKVKLSLYHKSIFTMFPLVKVPTDFDSFRKNSPLLFTTVMALTGLVQPDCSEADVDRDVELETISLRQVINELLLVGTKTTELLKCLTLLSVWYNTPELFHHRRYHIISSLCINMVQDLGLTGRPYYVVNKQEGSFSRSTLLEDPQKDEYRSLVLGVYSSSLGYCLFLRRKLQVHWSPYMEESYQHLKTCENEDFKNIAVFAKLCSVMERINLHVDVKDETNHLLIEYLKQEIQTYKDELTLDKDLVAGFTASVEAYLYSQFKTKEYTLKCHDATSRCIVHFGRLSPDKKAGIPVLIFGRLMYCFALLLKCSNILKLRFDYHSFKVLLDSLKICCEKYKKNHMLIKLRLLFYFYLSTFARNEDVFNNIVEVPSSEAVVKAVKLPGSTHTGTHPLHHIAQPHSQSQSQHPPGSHISQQAEQPATQQPQPVAQAILHNPSYPAAIDSTRKFPPEQELYQPIQFNGEIGSNILNPVSDANTTLTNHPTHFQQPQQPITQQISQQLQQLPQANFEEILELSTDPAIPYLDALSNETIKGFNELPNDFLTNQNDFWKMFDYKEEQFFL